MKEIFNIVLVIIGALIGAGFASGQEIYAFFYSYGFNGLIGIIITFILISFFIYKSLIIICKNEVDNYEEFLKIFVKSPILTKIINMILNILLLVTFYIMIAGFGAYFEQEIGISKIIGSFILVVISAVIFFTSVKGVLKVSEYVVPMLILSIIVIGGISLFTTNFDIEIPTLRKGWILSSVTYCSYNMLLLIPVLISLRKQITDSKNIKYISIISGILMVTVSIMLFMLLTQTSAQLSMLEMPIVYITSESFSKFKYIYAFVILASIFTTAISIGIGFLQNVSKNKKSYTQFVLLMCITSMLVSNIGFSKLVKFIYPLFGYLGIIQMFLIGTY